MASTSSTLIRKILSFGPFFLSPRCPATSPPRPRRSDKSEYIKEPRLRHEGTGRKGRRRAGEPGLAEGPRGSVVLKKRPVLDETQSPTRSLRHSSPVLHFVTAYSGRPHDFLFINAIGKTREICIRHDRTSPVRSRALTHVDGLRVVVPPRRRNTSRDVTRSRG